ncbi:MAG: hypothetical protein H6565_03595 [Lewinellaceae bacterium]|nr:hypothetical protein [Saprospiraceae bacterium]MCB9305660.1 hypothetical protein [Lewinellaceae bacterium]
MTNRLKNQTLLVATAIIAAMLAFGACRKSSEEIAAIISDSEAAEMVENNVSERTAGITTPTVDMAQIIGAYLDNCGVPGDTTIQKSNSNGQLSYACTYGLDWLINCNNLGVPQSAQVGVTGNGSFSTAHWEGQDQTSGSLTFAGLNPQASAYMVEGTYTLQGDVTGDLRRIDPTVNCTTTITLTGLGISKSDYSITGGNSTVQVVATNGMGNTRTLDGTIVFNGDGTATVVINGHSHTFPIQ